MAENFADRLLKRIAARNTPVCVGIDPVYSKLPPALKSSAQDHPDDGAALQAIVAFCSSVLKIVAPRVPCVKINSAFFERYHGAGVAAYHELVQQAAGLELLVIGDCKRGDVGHTAELYAQALLSDAPAPGGPGGVDAVTVHSYLGLDAVEPFISVAEQQGKGLFVLVQTSNPSASAVQDFADAEGSPLSAHVAGMVDGWAQRPQLVGSRGYSCVGAVVAPRNVELTMRLREMMPRCIFLVPGYGAQGATADHVKRCFKPDGTGALVNASRSVIYAFSNVEYQRRGDGSWEKCIELACDDFARDVARVLGM